MKINALNTYVCPISKGELSLHALEAHEINLTPDDIRRAKNLNLAAEELAQVVKTGILYCDTSRKWYPIINYVPLFIDYGTDIHREFVTAYQSQTDLFQRYEIPDRTPRSGEDTIRRTFTKEWA